ncbi:MAG: 5-formyltetrahydrofolate cyclo-ligase [Lachnospiraceae bacterium]|nr:5-formyltetrahydrofolate cyclo-ligase [Lachnospiraceae bacterium]
MLKKQELRKQYIQIRDSLPADARAECSLKICSIVEDSAEFEDSDIILCYAPIKSEVDVWPLFDTAISKGKKVGLPLVDGDGMDFYEVTSRGELKPGNFGVPEPSAAVSKKIDIIKGKTLMIVPGLAFDKTGNRMGYGKGFYDRFLHRHGENIRTMAVCFERQVAESLPADSTDIPVDCLTTINGVFDCRLRRRYETVIGRIENSRRFADAPGVETSAKILQALGDPDRKLEFIHVAGTNGKGSVCALTASALSEAGLRVGLFTSPHLISFNERIRIFNKENIINDMKHTCISDEDVVRLAEIVRGTADAKGITLTMFDYCFAIGILYFVEKNTDVVVLECGLGGRLDSTNAIGVPAVSAITSIGFDHMQYLGDSLTDIAAEKAGILKRGTEAFIGSCDESVREYFAKTCNEKDINVTFLQEDDIYEGALALKGEYQRRNARLSAMIVRSFFEKRKNLFPGDTDIDRVISAGFQKAAWDGRFQILRDKPLLIIDGAHNEHGVKALKEALMTAYPDRIFCFVMGVMKDKDFTGMLKDMLPLCRKFYASQTDYERTLPAAELARQAQNCGYTDAQTIVIEDIDSIPEDTVVFGSLYFVGDVLKRVIVPGQTLIQQ